MATHKHIVNGLVTVFAVPVVLLLISDATGIGAKDNGTKIYSVTSPFPEGREYIKLHQIKSIATDVQSVAFIDIRRGESFFAYDVQESYKVLYTTIRYTKVPNDIAEKYKLHAEYSWLNVYGKWIVLGLGALAGLYYLLRYQGIID